MSSFVGLLGLTIGSVLVSVDAPDETTKSLVNLLAKQLKDRDVKKRIDAAKELGNLGQKAQDAARALCEACMDPSGKVSVAAIDAIEKVRPDLHKHLVVIVADSNETKRDHAFQALEKLKDQASPATPIVLAYILRSASNQRFRKKHSVAMRCLSQIATDDATLLSPLVTLAKQHPSTELAADCIAVLSTLAQGQRELRKKVFPVLVSSLTTSNRLPAIQGLGRLGADAKDALPALKKLKFDGDETIRNAANDAIQKIESN